MLLDDGNCVRIRIVITDLFFAMKIIIIIMAPTAIPKNTPIDIAPTIPKITTDSAQALRALRYLIR